MPRLIPIAILSTCFTTAACERSSDTSEDAQTAEATAAATATATASTAPTATAEASCEKPCASIERCEDGTCVPACPEGEVYIPATGSEGFTMGREGSDEAKPHQVVLTEPFCIDATEVTAGAYAECVEADVCEAPRNWGRWVTYGNQPKHPVNKVHWKHAKTYCEWRGESLPTEAQWAFAARGKDDRKWAWGDEEPTCKHADFTSGVLRSGASDDGCHGGGTSEVGAHPDGDRVWPDGPIHDLSGNVWEWVLDNHVPFSGEDAVDPLVLENPEGTHVVRGGGWNRSARGIRVDYRGGAVVDYRVPGLGFRCVRNPGDGEGPNGDEPDGDAHETRGGDPRGETNAGNEGPSAKTPEDDPESVGTPE